MKYMNSWTVFFQKTGVWNELKAPFKKEIIGGMLKLVRNAKQAKVLLILDRVKISYEHCENLGG